MVRLACATLVMPFDSVEEEELLVLVMLREGSSVGRRRVKQLGFSAYCIVESLCRCRELSRSAGLG